MQFLEGSSTSRSLINSEKAMGTSNLDAAFNNSRRLLEGERVEVRQKERGLRGSWHTGTVVKVKYCRRLVEYDELFTQDGSRKLKETIPLCEEVKPHTSTRRDTNVEAPNLEEGDVNENVSLKKRGFIRPSPPPCLIPSRQDWRRGLLVDAFYNDAWWEGILLDDVTSDCGELKTKIFFPEEGDELEISLKDLRVSQEWDEASGLWAGRGYWFLNGELGLGALKEICIKVKCPVKDLWRQRRFCSSEGIAMQEQRIKHQQSVEKTLQSQPLILEYIGNSFLGAGYDSTEFTIQNTYKELDSPSLLPLVPREASRYDSTGQLSIPKSKKKRFDANMCLNEELAGKARANPRVTWMVERKNSHDQYMGESQEECTSAIHDSEIKVDPLLCENNENRRRRMDGNHGAFSSAIRLPLKVRVRQARLAAKTYLLRNGWKIDSRLRHRGTTTKYEAVYISPSGSRFFSLAAACRELRPDIGIPSSSPEGTDSVLEAYQIAEGLTHMHHFHTCPSGTKQISFINGSTNDSCGSDSATVPELMDFMYNSPKHQHTTPGFPTLYNEETLKEKRNTSISLEKSNKRKSEECSGFSEESKHKRCKGYLKGSRNLTENKGSGVKGGCRMQVLLSCPERTRDQKSCHDIGGLPQFKKSTVLSWLIDKSILKENEPVVYINRKDGQVMKKGKVTREGIMCDCCKDTFTLSNFEAHAGSKLHRPSANIFLDNGKSISDCQLEACALQDAKEKKEGIMDVSDDSCGVCGDGGELVLCDHCPSTFHADCIGLTVIPEGDWHCPRCSCGVCGTNQRMGDFDDRMLRCIQCELKYHPSCVRTRSVLPLGQDIQKIWFCDRNCQKIFIGLRQLVGITHSMEGGFSWMLLRAMKKNHTVSQSNLEVMAEHNSKLSVAYDVMRECFVPMIDPRTRINLLSQALYNRRSKVARLNYGGFYTMLLERGDEIISVATIRVHGVKLAEMPLVGTRYQYRRQGMCRRLVHVLEEMLKNVGVEKLILPAVPELLETWTSAFGFQQMGVPDMQELSKVHLMTFPGTSLLQKHLVDDSNSSKPDYQPDTSNEFDSLENSSCKSMEEFFSMTCASLDNNFLKGNMNGDASLINSTVFNYMQELFSDDQDTPELLKPSKAGKPKSQIRYKAEVGSPNDAQTIGKGREDDIYTRVVIGTTRSKRQVKSRRWVADGLRELKDSKLSRRIITADVNSSKTPACESGQDQDCEPQNIAQSCELQDTGQSIEKVYVRTRRKRPSIFAGTIEYNAASGLTGAEDIANWSAIKISNYMELRFSGCEVMGEIQFCPKFYTRRKKGESKDIIQDHSNVDSRSGDFCLDQASVAPLNDNNKEFVISSTPSFNPNPAIEHLTRQGAISEVMIDDSNVVDDGGNAEVLNDYSCTGMMINNSNVIEGDENRNLERLDASIISTSGNTDRGPEMFGTIIVRRNAMTVIHDGSNQKVLTDENAIYENCTAEFAVDNSNVMCSIDDSNLVRSRISACRTNDIGIFNGSVNSETLNNDSNVIYGGRSELMFSASGGLACNGDSSLERFGTSIISTGTTSSNSNAGMVTNDYNILSASGTVKIKINDSNASTGDANVVGGTAKLSTDDSNGRHNNIDCEPVRFCPREIQMCTDDANAICSTAEKLVDDCKPKDSNTNRNLHMFDSNIVCTDDVNIDSGNVTADPIVDTSIASTCDVNVMNGSGSAEEMDDDYEDSRQKKFKLNVANVNEFNIICGCGNSTAKIWADNSYIIDDRPDSNLEKFDTR